MLGSLHDGDGLGKEARAGSKEHEQVRWVGSWQQHGGLVCLGWKWWLPCSAAGLGRRWLGMVNCWAALRVGLLLACSVAARHGGGRVQLGWLAWALQEALRQLGFKAAVAHGWKADLGSGWSLLGTAGRLLQVEAWQLGARGGAAVAHGGEATLQVQEDGAGKRGSGSRQQGLAALEQVLQRAACSGWLAVAAAMREVLRQLGKVVLEEARWCSAAAWRTGCSGLLGGARWRSFKDGRSSLEGVLLMVQLTAEGQLCKGAVHGAGQLARHGGRR